MMTFKVLIGAGAVVAVMAAPTGLARAQTMSGHPGMAASPDDAPATRGFKAAHDAMMKKMMVPYTGDPDADFRIQMIPHHEGAIEMAEVALKYARDPATRRLAQTIADDQKREVAEMKAWLAEHGK